MASEKDEAAIQAEQIAYAESLQKQIDKLIYASDAPSDEKPQSLRDVSEQIARAAEEKSVTKTKKPSRRGKKGKP